MAFKTCPKLAKTGGAQSMECGEKNECIIPSVERVSTRECGLMGQGRISTASRPVEAGNLQRLLWNSNPTLQFINNNYVQKPFQKGLCVKLPCGCHLCRSVVRTRLASSTIEQHLKKSGYMELKAFDGLKNCCSGANDQSNTVQKEGITIVR